MTSYNAPLIWMGVGYAGQALFAARFLVQWMHSEVMGRSRFPQLFWHISVLAGALVLLYAVHRHDPIFIAGEATTLIIFCRNLQLIRKKTVAQDRSKGMSS